MMKAIFLLASVLIGVNLAEAQTKKVRAKDLDGIWQMKISLKEGFMDEDIEEEDNVFARMIMQATGNFVEGVIDEIDVKFEFLANGKCKVYASAFDQEGGIEYTKWWINSNGELYIDDTDTIDTDDDDYWLFEDDVLVLREGNGRTDDDANVILYRID